MRDYVPARLKPYIVETNRETGYDGITVYRFYFSKEVQTPNECGDVICHTLAECVNEMKQCRMVE